MTSLKSWVLLRFGDRVGGERLHSRRQAAAEEPAAHRLIVADRLLTDHKRNDAVAAAHGSDRDRGARRAFALGQGTSLAETAPQQ